MTWLASCFGSQRPADGLLRADGRTADCTPAPPAVLLSSPEASLKPWKAAAADVSVAATSRRMQEVSAGGGEHSCEITAQSATAAGSALPAATAVDASASASRRSRLRVVSASQLATAPASAVLTVQRQPDGQRMLVLGTDGSLALSATHAVASTLKPTKIDGDLACWLHVRHVNIPAADCAAASGSGSYDQLLMQVSAAGGNMLGAVLDSAAQAAVSGWPRKHQYHVPREASMPALLHGSTIGVQAILWRDADGEPAPALLLQHSLLSQPSPVPVPKLPTPPPSPWTQPHVPRLVLPASPADQASPRHMMPETQALDSMPVMVTLWSLTGEPMYQNKASCDYFGNLRGRTRTVTAPQLLDQLFCIEEEAGVAVELLQAVQAGRRWRKVVRVPRSLLCGSVRHAQSLLAMEGSGGGCHPSVARLQSPITNSQRSFTDILTALGSNMSRPNGLMRLQDRSRDNSMLPSITREMSSASKDDAIAVESLCSMREEQLSERQRSATGAGAAVTAAGDDGVDDLSASSQLMRLLVDDESALSASQIGAEGMPVPSVHTHTTSMTSMAVQAMAGVGVEEDDDDEGDVFHEVLAQRVPNPATGQDSWLLLQTDATSRANMETMFAELMEFQLTMLSSIFPRHIVEFLSVNDVQDAPESFGQIARSHEDVTILFCDIVGFTTMSDHVPARSVMVFLNELFTKFDSLVSKHHVHKVETAGDCYIVAAGVVRQDTTSGFFVLEEKHDPADSALRVLAFAKDMLHASRLVRMPHNGERVTIRIGLHTGPCVSGLVGTSVPKFAVFGDTMNTASRMESTCVPGHIQVSASTWQLLSQREKEAWRPTGGIEVKGKGVMETFLWQPAPSLIDQQVNENTNSGALSGILSKHLSAMLLKSPALQKSLKSGSKGSSLGGRRI